MTFLSLENVKPAPAIRVRYRSEKLQFDVFAESKSEAENATIRYIFDTLGPNIYDLPQSLTAQPYKGHRRGVYVVFFDNGKRTVYSDQRMPINKAD